MEKKNKTNRRVKLKEEGNMAKSFYIKKDGKIEEVDERTYEEYNDDAIFEGKRYLCKDCSVCTCEKIRYTDINRSEGVNDATYKIIKPTKAELKGNEDAKTLASKYGHIDFLVYDCEYFKKFSDVNINEEYEIKNRIIYLDKKIFSLIASLNKKEDEITRKQLKKLIRLRFAALEMIKSEIIKHDIELREKKLANKCRIEMGEDFTL